jgi:hypothetical protein
MDIVIALNLVQLNALKLLLLTTIRQNAKLVARLVPIKPVLMEQLTQPRA